MQPIEAQISFLGGVNNLPFLLWAHTHTYMKQVGTCKSVIIFYSPFNFSNSDIIDRETA